MTDALIVIDMQQRPFGDSPPWHDAAGLVVSLNRLASAVRTAGGTVFFIQHDGPPGDPYQPGSPGWRFFPDLDVRPADTFILNQSCDAYLHTSLKAFLRAEAIDRLIITGWAEYCVDTTIGSALARGYSTIVPSGGHTAADRPHLAAAKIIEHHNAIWADFIAPRGPPWCVPAPR